MCYAWHTKLPAIKLHGRTFYFTSAATIRQLLKVLLTEIKARKGQKRGRKTTGNVNRHKLFPTEFKRSFGWYLLQRIQTLIHLLQEGTIFNLLRGFVQEMIYHQMLVNRYQVYHVSVVVPEYGGDKFLLNVGEITRTCGVVTQKIATGIFYFRILFLSFLLSPFTFIFSLFFTYTSFYFLSLFFFYIFLIFFTHISTSPSVFSIFFLVFT
jgi:hypothetical protein